ncbi:zinc-ribbon and DUF3426 domain-containing protein [Halopseudomonas xiamenensis]|uniref:zinc-ribbon and DUF3426 domain-containing protein n=1 Tax=Halopseudomonas xiamenensis TaxID=157792 RepID=UPI001624D80F|nr:zinc-ribbon and DUF3426 domain-containing protein [Halopseudomonas xiamenensis]
MSELLVTQCPYCQTRFRLTAEQLNVAAGNVRCGACLEVFHAGDAAAAMQQDLPARAEPDPARPSSLLQDDLDEPDLAALGLDESIIDEVNPTGMTGHRQSGLEAALPASDDQPPTEIDTPSPAEPFADLHEDFLATPPARDFGPDFDHNRLGDQDLDADGESHDDHDIFDRDRPTTTAPADISPAPDRQHEEQSPTVDTQPDLADAPAADNPQPERREPQLTALRLELLEEELLSGPPARPRQRTWLWNSLCLLALLVLAGQFFYYNFDALARDQRTRPLLENLCLIARCELPARVDISRIRSANLLVRQHPEFPNALAIDVILYNRADFEQPFPVLQMHFTDAGGREVSARSFRPEEYLSGELAGVRLMPPQTPIHVGLSMLDPGPQASGYRLEFLSP